MKPKFPTDATPTARTELKSGLGERLVAGTNGLRLFRLFAATVLSAIQFRERERRQFHFSPVTRLICCLLTVLMAAPTSLWACDLPHPCTTTCCTTGGGGPNGGKPPASGCGPRGCFAPIRRSLSEGNQNAAEIDPVHLGTAQVYMMSAELMPLGLPGGIGSAALAFGRFYTTQNPETGPLGAGWTHNYNVTLTTVGTSAIIKDGTATERAFLWEAGVWIGGLNVDGSSRLYHDGNDNFVWELRHGTKYTFDKNHDHRLASITDRLGHTVTLSYDGNSRLASAADGTGRTVTFVNDGNERIRQVIDPLNRTNFYYYDASGQLTNVADALGFKAAYVCQAGNVGRVTLITNANGQVHGYGYDAVGRAVAATNALGFVERYGWDDIAMSVAVTNRNGNVSMIYNNERGFPVRQVNAAGTHWHFRDAAHRVTNSVSALGYTNRFVYEEGSCACGISGEVRLSVDPLNRTNRWSYDHTFHFPTGFTNAANHVTTWTYDHRGNLTNATDALGHATRFVIDAAGNTTQTIDPLGRTDNFLYDQYGNLTNVADPLGHAIRSEYDILGRLTRRVDPLNATNSFTYDARDRLIRQVDALGQAEAWAYDGNGHETAWTNKLGQVTTYAYDNADQLVAVTLPASANPFLTYAYDANGNPVGETNALNHATRHGYDALDRLTATTNALGKVWTFGYDAEGRRTRATDPDQHSAWFTYDAAGQLRFTTNAENQTIQFQYDLVGNRTNIIDARNNALGFRYDPLHRLTNLVYAANDSERFAYDPAGNLTHYTTRADEQIQSIYDPANRLTNKTYTGGSDVMTFGYDAANRMTNVLWKVGSATNSHVTFQYDAAGRLTNESQKISTAAPKSIRYDYDAAGRKTRLTYPDNSFITYAYNANGWLTNISDSGTTTIVSYEYDAAGHRTKRTLENSTFTVYEYDQASQMTSIAHKKNNPNQTLISRYQYGYDDAGQRKWVKRGNGYGDVYRYDATDQLTNVLYEATNPDTSPSGWTNEVRYFFDAAGNRTNVTATSSGTTVYVPNHLNQYTAVGSTTPTYDANGNLTSDGTWTYTYDRENRLVQAVNGETTINYTYDAFNRLIERAVGASVTRFYYDDQWRLVAEYDQNDTLTRKYVYGPEIDEPVRMTHDSENYYYHAAALGTVTEITDAAGNSVEAYRYDVYGEPTIYDSTLNPQPSTAIGNRLLFQGRDRDPATGLYNFRNRYYSPALGRFVQVDPIREKGGLNLYGFVQNNPVRYSDPDGQWCIPCIIGGIIIIIGGGCSKPPPPEPCLDEKDFVACIQCCSDKHGDHGMDMIRCNNKCKKKWGVE